MSGYTGPVPTGAPGDPVPLGRVTLVVPDPSSYVDDFAYMAAIPTAVFAHGGVQYLSPLVFCTGSTPESWLLDDWADYAQEDGGITSAVVVGRPPASLSRALQQRLHTMLWPQIAGSSAAEVASLLALYDWHDTDVAVLALGADSFDVPPVVNGSSQYTFQDADVVTLTPDAQITDDSPVPIDFVPPSSAGWLDCSINWTGPEVFTHTLKDPLGHLVDYSYYSQVYFERRRPFVPSPVPLHFWVPKTADGEWTVTLTPRTAITRTISLDCEFRFHPGFTRTITVPTSARSLNVTVSWDNMNTDLNFALLDPDGNLVAWDPSTSILSSPGVGHLSVPYPRAGSWQLVVAWMDPVATETNNVEISWTVDRLPTGIEGYLESAANGAVLASLLDAPLLFVDPSGIPAATRLALERLGVQHVLLVDPAGLRDGSLTTALNEYVVTVFGDYASLSSAIWSFGSTALGTTGADIVLTVPYGSGEELFGPAAFAAARQAAPVFSLRGGDGVPTTAAEATWAPYLIGPEIDAFYVTSRYTTRTENGWYDERIPNRYTMEGCASTLESFLSSRGALSNVTQSVTIFAPTSVLKPSFDRALQSHFAPGRIPARGPPLASVMTARTSLHRFLFRSADSSDTALLSMYAYTDGAVYYDKAGTPHTIRQIEDSAGALQAAGFSVDYHVGRDAVFEALNSQVALWSFSTHGTLTRLPTDPPERPGGLGMFSMRDTDSPYGFEVSVSDRKANDGDDLVNPVQYEAEYAHHVFTSTDELDSAVGRIGSPIVIITACLLGGSILPEALMKHGAVAVIASPRTVYFQPAGLLSILITQRLAQGAPVGEALNYGLATVSPDYTDPDSGVPRDYGNQQVLFGDPTVHLYPPGSTPRLPVVAPVAVDAGGHTPCRGIPPVAVVTSQSFVPSALAGAGVAYDRYDATNLTAAKGLLTIRSTVLVAPDGMAVLRGSEALDPTTLDQYLHSGGTIVLFGLSAADMAWLPWDVSVTDTGTGTGVTLRETGHPLLTRPNDVPAELTYHGVLDVLGPNFTLLASASDGSVLAASLVGSGKLAVSTVHPEGAPGRALVQNAATWSQSPALVLQSVALNEYVIWEGDRVTITLEVTDRAGVGVPGVNMSVHLGEVEVGVVDSGSGVYTVTLDQSWTSGRAGTYDLTVHASKDGYDTLTVTLPDLVFIRPITWGIMIVVGAAVLTVVAVAVHIHRRRTDGPGRGDRSRREGRAEKKRRREDDARFDPREALGL